MLCVGSCKKEGENLDVLALLKNLRGVCTQQHILSWDFIAMREVKQKMHTDHDESFNIICGEWHFIRVILLYIK